MSGDAYTVELPDGENRLVITSILMNHEDEVYVMDFNILASDDVEKITVNIVRKGKATFSHVR